MKKRRNTAPGFKALDPIFLTVKIIIFSLTYFYPFVRPPKFKGMVISIPQAKEHLLVDTLCLAVVFYIPSN